MIAAGQVLDYLHSIDGVITSTCVWKAEAIRSFLKKTSNRYICSKDAASYEVVLLVTALYNKYLKGPGCEKVPGSSSFILFVTFMNIHK